MVRFQQLKDMEAPYKNGPNEFWVREEVCIENGYLDSTSLCDCSNPDRRIRLGTADASGTQTAW